MSIIKAPFNFVPLNKEVFYPDWADCISQDVPFEDGESGTITLDIEALSPIFVRNGNLQGEGVKQEDKEKEFSKDADGNYFIPGSSIKGMLRSVLEVLSFGKLGIYNDDKYAFRDLNNRELYMSRMVPQDRKGKKFIRCGWLQKKGDYYILSDRGEPGRISFSDIDQMFNTNMNSFFQKGGGYLPNNEEHKSAKFKYSKYDKVGAAKKIWGFKPTGARGFTKSDSGKQGIIVFTGQPSPRVPAMGRQSGKGKGSEFIFWETPIHDYNVDEDVIKNFKFAYFEHDKNNRSIDWKYWRVKLENEEPIPVFFQLDKAQTKVIHLGLSYLYKLPYDNSVGDFIDKTQGSRKERLSKMDLAECIFGRIEEEMKIDEGKSKKKIKLGAMLKGRVHIGHAFAQNAAKPLPEKQAVLSSPKASYYPIYIEQKTNNGQVGRYNTFMDKDANLAGIKRYPIHKNGVTENKGTDATSTTFIPLDKGAKFQCKIYYHNLQKSELGALLSAITFHNTQDCFHSLGMGKPLGYGKIKVSVNMDLEKQKTYLRPFEELMNGHQKNWANSPALQELVTMASEQNNTGNSDLSYMKMSTKREDNEFNTAKNNKEALSRYSKLNGIKAKSITSLSANAINNTLNCNTLDSLKKQLESRLSLCKNTLGEKTTETRPAQEKTTTPQKDETPPQKQNNPAVPQFLQKGKLSAGKRYDMEAVVTKSGNPNSIKVYVKDGTVQENVKLDIYRNPLEVGKVIVVTVSVDGKEKVTQASFKAMK